MSWQPYHISDINFTSQCSEHWHDWVDDQAYGFELSTSEILLTNLLVLMLSYCLMTLEFLGSMLT